MLFTAILILLVGLAYMLTVSWQCMVFFFSVPENELRDQKLCLFLQVAMLSVHQNVVTAWIGLLFE